MYFPLCCRNAHYEYYIINDETIKISSKLDLIKFNYIRIIEICILYSSCIKLFFVVLNLQKSLLYIFKTVA